MLDRENVLRGLPGILMGEKYCLGGSANHRCFGGPGVSWSSEWQGDTQVYNSNSLLNFLIKLIGVTLVNKII